MLCTEISFWGVDCRACACSFGWYDGKIGVEVLGEIEPSGIILELG